MKKFLLLLLALILLFNFGCKKEEKQITMKLGHYGNETHASQEAALMFAKAVEERTNGRIKIAIYPNNQLGAPPEVLEQNILGAIEMSLPGQDQLAHYLKKMACAGLPYAFESYEHADRVLDGPFAEWTNKDLEDLGLIYLSNWEWGFRHLTNSKKPINSPEDVKGLKIRVPPTAGLQAAIEAMGGNVQTIQWPEVPMALKQGVVDGQENPIPTIVAFKLYETQPYLSLTGHFYSSMVHVISKKTWDKLSKKEQKIFKEESKKAGDYMRKKIRDGEAEMIKFLEDQGIQVTKVDKSKFKAVMGPAYEKLQDACGGKENIETFLKMCADKL